MILEEINLLTKNQYDRKRKLYPNIVQVGAGGNGGYVVQQTAQLLSAFKMNGKYLIADPDVVEEKNLRNQLFVERDIGNKKADVLAKRYESSYKINISRDYSGFIEDSERLTTLFNINSLGRGHYDYFELPILISCVDNNFTRKLFNEYFESANKLLYIDVGIHETKVPKDFPNRPKEEWTEEELNNYNQSGWSGQLVCGLKLGGKTILEPLASVFPDVLEDEEVAPSELACSDLIASEPQRLVTNRMAAQAVNIFLNELFESGTISNHMNFFHGKKGSMRGQGFKIEVPEKIK